MSSTKPHAACDCTDLQPKIGKTIFIKFVFQNHADGQAIPHEIPFLQE